MDDNNKLEIMMTEYKCMKEEIKSFFDIQIKIVLFWLTFLGVLLGYFFDNYSEYISLLNSADSSAPQSFYAFIIKLLLFILIPGICNLLGLIWLDFTNRTIKAAHYLFMFEDKIKNLFKNNNPNPLDWEHYVVLDSSKGKAAKFINFYYYFFMLGCFFILPPIFCLISIIQIDLYKDINIFFLLGVISIESFTLIFVRMYIKKILGYKKEDSGSKKTKSNIKDIIAYIFFVILIIGALYLAYICSSSLIRILESFLLNFNFVLPSFLLLIFGIIIFIVLLFVMYFIFTILLVYINGGI